MKKGKHIFSAIFALLLSLLSITALNMYDNIEHYSKTDSNATLMYYNDHLESFTIYLAQQLDKNYVPYQLSADIPEDVRNDFLTLQQSNEDSIADSLMNDPTFQYVATDAKTKTIRTNIPNYNPNTLDPEKYTTWIEFSYDENGTCHSDSPAISLTFDEFSNFYSDLEDIIDESYVNNDFENPYSTNSLIQLNHPTNLEIKYLIPKDVDSYHGIGGYVNRLDNFIPSLSVLYCIFAAVISLFILFYPRKYVEQAEPFKAVIHWDFEINVILFAVLITFLTIGTLFVAGNTINGYFHYLLQDQLRIHNIQPLLFACNFFIWLLALLCIAIAVFLLKHICCSGIFHYFKEHSLLGKFCRKCRQIITKVSYIDFTSPTAIQTLKIVCINSIILLLIGAFFFPISWIFVIIYSVLLFIFLQKKVSEFQANYNDLLDSIKDILSGKYSSTNSKNLGIFEASRPQLTELNESFEQAVQEKVSSQKLKTELISNVSHDLKTPLTCIKNYSELLNSENLSDEDRKHYLKQLSFYTERMKHLIEDLFEVSKADSGNISLNKQELDLTSLLDQAYIQNEELLEPKHLQVIRKYGEEKVLIELDSEKTYRVFENLYTNISKYALHDSRVYIALSQDDTDIHIDFSNISEQPMDFTAEEITERFVRGDRSRSEQGSGLGLAIAKSFVEAQGGTFTISIDCDLFKVHITFPKNSSHV